MTELAHSGEAISRLTDQESLLDATLQIEDYLDSLDLYAFENWIDGQIVEGPNIKRYWVEMTLKYNGDSKPDKRGALRLVKFGTKVKFEKTTEEVTVDVKDDTDLDENGEPKTENQKVWLVYLKIPRRFIEDNDLWDLDTEEEDFSVEDVGSAEDEGVDEESGITDEGGEDDMDMDMEDEEFEL